MWNVLFILERIAGVETLSSPSYHLVHCSSQSPVSSLVPPQHLSNSEQDHFLVLIGTIWTITCYTMSIQIFLFYFLNTKPDPWLIIPWFKLSTLQRKAACRGSVGGGEASIKVRGGWRMTVCVQLRHTFNASQSNLATKGGVWPLGGGWHGSDEDRALIVRGLSGCKER